MKYSTDDLGFSRLLVKSDLFEDIEETPESVNNFIGGTSPATLGSGGLTGNLEMLDGYMQSGNFVTGSAGWKLSYDGDFEASSGTFRGTITATTGTIGAFEIGSDYIRDVANSFGLASTVTGGDDVRFWAGATYANRATAPLRLTEGGIISATGAVIDGTSTLGGRLGSTLASAIDANGDLVTDIINARLDTEAQDILAEFTFGASGALQIGTYVNGVSGDIKISPSGIVARGTAGTNTFTLNGTTGAATFAGTLSAPSGTFGTITAGTLNGMVIDGTSTLGGRLGSTIAAALDANGDLVNDLINARIDTESKNILDEFTFGVSGALQIGTYSAGVSGDLRISPSGIVGRNSSNIETFAIDATDGSATFRGSITSSDIQATAISGGTIDGVIITGGLFRTAASGQRTEIDLEGIKLMSSSTGYTYGDSTYKYGDATRKYGTGVLAYLNNSIKKVPFYVQAEQAVADIHLVNRTSDPSGAAEIGDLCVVNGRLKICTTAGTPGGWEPVGAQAAISSLSPSLSPSKSPSLSPSLSPSISSSISPSISPS